MSVVSDSVRPHRRQPTRLPIPGILQARTLEWVAISFSNAWKWKVKVKSFSRVRLLATPWTAAYQAPPSMGFSRQKYWSGVPLPSLEGKVGSKQFESAWGTWEIYLQVPLKYLFLYLACGRQFEPTWTNFHYNVVTKIWTWHGLEN